MSIEENVGALEGAIETIEQAMQNSSETLQFGGDAIVAIKEVAGSTAPQHLEQAMQMVSEGQHQVEQANAVYGAAIEQVREYIELLSS